MKDLPRSTIMRPLILAISLTAATPQLALGDHAPSKEVTTEVWTRESSTEAMAGSKANAHMSTPDSESLTRLKAPAPSHDEQALVISRAYRRLSEYMKNAGAVVEFEISDLHLLERKNFGTILYKDVATLPEGWLIDVERREIVDEVNGVRAVRYSPSWRRAEVDWNSSEDLAAMISFDLAEILGELSRESIAWQQTSAATLFTVTASFAGRDRAYAAAFFWSPQQKAGKWGITPLDHVTAGLDRALIEKIPIEGEPIAETDWSPEEKILSTGSCEPDSEGFNYYGSTRIGTGGHFTGHHEAYAQFNQQCTCDSSCRSTCSAGPTITTCEESPTTTLYSTCHVLVEDFAMGISSKSNAIISGAECSAGYTCGQQSCAFCVCSPLVQVTLAGLQVTFGGSSGIEWRANYALTAVDCPPCNELPPPSPILLNFSGKFELSGLSSPVSFDIDADGDREQLSWTVIGGDEAFLCLDRNGNGTIDDGAELFGTFTPQNSSGEPNGFKALSVFDDQANGGNNDGEIDDRDSIFSSLCLWHDRNRDGLTQADELSNLESAGVTAIDLKYVRSNRRDKWGNRFRWKSRYRTAGGSNGEAIDVVFLISPAE